jgi:ADP-heptose:LPS heptosyltransferase
LRQITVDTVIDCELFSRISSLYSFFSGAKLKVGFHPYNQEGLYRGSFINRPVLYNPYNHISQQFITLAEAIDSEMVPKAKRKITMDSIDVPDIEIDKQEIDNFYNKARTDFSINEDRKLVLIYPGGGLLPIRAWPLENYCLVVKDLIEKGFAVGIVGVENDKKLADEILSSCQSRFCMDFTGYTKTVKELMVMFHFTSLLITNDGGPGHFASMTPVPVITLYGPETPMLYGALSPKSYNFYIPLSCSPCLSAFNHRNSPCDGNNLCLKYIRPEDVLAKAYKMIEDMGMN